MRTTSLAWVLLAGGCLAAPAPPRGYPLYTAANAPLPPEQVARLRTVMPGGVAPGGGASSFIKSIDGREVGGVDAIFELLPGCHLVETQQSVVVSNANVAFMATLPPLVFPFRMRAGHEHDVVVRFGEPMGSSGHLSVHAVHRNPATGHSQEIAPARSEADLEACRAWTPVGP